MQVQSKTLNFLTSHLFPAKQYLHGLPTKFAAATDAEIEEPNPFTDIDEDENELEKNEVVLEDCLLCFLLSLNYSN